MQSVSTNDLRKINRQSVLTQLAQAGTASRLELAKRTGLTTAGISRITRELIDSGLIEETNATSETASRGRRTQKLQFTDSGAWLIVMVISANRQSVALASSCGKIHKAIELEDLDLSSPLKALNKYASCANKLIDNSGIDRRRVLGISILAAVNTKPTEQGRISSDVLGWKEIPVTSHIAARTNLKVHLEARAVGLLQSELWQRPNENQSSVILVNNGWRLGSSVFVNGQLLENSDQRLGQLSHYAIPGNNTACYCGQTGCLDMLASGSAVIDSVNTSLPNRLANSLPPIQQLTAAINQADSHPPIAEAFTRAGQYLGTGLNALYALYNPQRIFLAGTTCRQKHYIDGVKQAISKRLSLAPDDNHPARAHCRVEICTISSIDAAIRSGLEEFLFSGRLDLQQFQNDVLTA